MSQNSLLAAPPPAVLIHDWRDAARVIDHTLLKPEATRSQLIALCDQAAHYGFHCVVVTPANVPLAASQLRGTAVNVGTVIGFPLGANATPIKLTEAELALRDGARELDMVINLGALKSGNRELVTSEMRSLARLAHSYGGLLKAILENALLTQEEKILACALAMEAGVDYVKTSTGFAATGATAADVALMRGVVGHKLGVKAAGGIRTSEQFVEMIEAGASRIGCSASVEIVRALGAPAE